MDQSAATLMQQNEMLRDIRDEIRQSRISSGGGMLGNAATAGRPANTFIQAQTFADRMIAGDWNTFGWTQSYKPNFKSNLSQDIMGMLGLRNAPNTMTQIQYQQLAAESLHARVANFAGGLVAPQFTGRVENLTNDIFAQSSRFSRFGDADTSMFGAGVSLSSARHIAQQIQTASITDMRMSGADYNNVVSTGMKMGQFDGVHGQDDFIRKAKEMASAVGDLTRVLHMSVDEVSKSMGALRMNGVTDIADQRRTMMQVGAAAQVGGLTSGEAMQAWARGAQIGGGMGISAQVGGQVNMNNLAQVRNMSRGGLVPSYVMALGGGAEGISANMSEVQMGLLSSSFGQAALAGGAGKAGVGFMDAMTQGMGQATSGGAFGFAGFQRNAMKRMNDLQRDPNRVADVTQSMIESKLSMLGVSDFTSKEATDASFLMFKQQGANDATAYAMSEQMFTQRGRRSTASTRYNLTAAKESEQTQLDYDAWARNNTFMGRFNTATKQLGEFPASAANYLQGVGEDVVNRFMPGASAIEQKVRATDMGLRPDSVSRDSFLRGLNGGMNAQVPAVQFASPGGGGYWGGWSGFGVGAMAGGALGSLLGPLGTMIGGAAGGWLGEKLGTAAGAYMDSGAATKLEGQAAIDYQKAVQGSSTSLNDADLKGALGKLNKTGEFGFLRDLLKNKTGQLSAVDSQKAINLIRGAAAASGVSVDTASAAASNIGLNTNFADTFKSMDFSSEAGSKKYADVLNSLGLGNISGVDLSTGAGAGALNKYLTALNGGKQDEIDEASTGLTRQGMKSDDLTKLRQRFSARQTYQNFSPYGGGNTTTGLSSSERQDILNVVSAREKGAGSREAQRFFKTSNSVAASMLEDASSEDAAFKKVAEDLRDNKLNIFDVLGNDKYSKEQDVLGKQFEPAMKLMHLSTSELASLSAKDAQEKYGISEASFNDINNSANDQEAEAKKGGRAFNKTELLRRGLAGTAIQGMAGQLAEKEKSDKSAKEAEMLNSAATIFKQITDKLKISG